MKEKIQVFVLFIPSLIGLIIGLVFTFQKVNIGETTIISGEITEFFKGSSSRHNHKPMYIVIDNEKYIISYGVRWSIDYNQLLDTLKVGNEVELEVTNLTKNVVSIKENGNVLVTVEQTIICLL